MPKAPKTKNLAGLLKLFLISAAALGLIGCGGGGGSGDDEPAPQTMNGVILHLRSDGGPVLTMIRSSGDAASSGEEGSVLMGPNPGSIVTRDSSGQLTETLISPTISGAVYTYTRTSSVSGRLVIEGEGQTFIPGTGSATEPFDEYSYFGGMFSRTYDMIFASDGNLVSTVATTDYDTEEGLAGFAIFFDNGFLRLIGGGTVPVGWNLEKSSGLVLPKLYPLRLSTQLVIFSYPDAPEDTQTLTLLTSSFTPLSPRTGDFIEKGIGTLRIGDDPAPLTIGYEYSPDADTTNQVKLKILRSSFPSSVYEMNFRGRESGSFVDGLGRVGEFRIPFLEF